MECNYECSELLEFANAENIRDREQIGQSCDTYYLYALNCCSLFGQA